MQLSIMIEGQMGVNWAKWQSVVRLVETLGFAGLFRSDHFTNLNPPDLDSLEAIVSLANLATITSRIHFGTLVAPFSFREPVMLARQAITINELSGGRMILGVGAGWQEREHNLFGYSLGDIITRFQRFEEGLQVTCALIRNSEAVNFSGNFYSLNGATLFPRPKYKLPILVGGNGMMYTLPLAARYADIWNGVMLSVQEFRDRSDALESLVAAADRQDTDLRRTVMLPVLCWRTPSELDERMNWVRKLVPSYSNFSTREILLRMQKNMAAITGSPAEITAKIELYEQAGADEMMMQWLAIEDLEGISILAQELLHFQE